MLKFCTQVILIAAVTMAVSNNNLKASECSPYLADSYSRMQAECDVENAFFTSELAANPYAAYGSAHLVYSPYNSEISGVACGIYSSRAPYDLVGYASVYSPLIPNTCFTIIEQPPTIVSTNNANSCTRSGSIIQTSNQVIGEVIPLVGLPFYLSHFSSRVEGRIADYTLNIPIKSRASSVAALRVDISDDQNNLISTVTLANRDQSYNYLWSGKDSSGNKTWASEKLKIDISSLSNEAQVGSGTNNKIYYLFAGSLKAKKLGLGGWLPSIWHFYDSLAEKVYNGDGTSRNAKAVKEGIYIRVASADGAEVYYFDSIGRVALTRTGLTGSILYTFNYDQATQKLLNITDSFNRVTKFKYDSNGNLIQIISPENVKNNFTVDVNGYLKSVSNPKNEIYSMAYKDAGGLLSSFTKPNGAQATFTYDDVGNLLTDVNSGGQSSTLIKTDKGINAVSTLGRITQNNYDASTNTEVEIRPSGLATTYVNAPDLASVSNVISVTKSNLTNDPRFGDQVKTFSNTETTNFGTSRTVVEDSVNLNDLTNPFSIGSLTKVTTEGSSEITSTFDGLTRTSTVASKLGRKAISQIDEKERIILEQIGDLAPKKYSYQNDLLSKITNGERNSAFTYDFGTKLLSKITNSLNQSVVFSYDEAQRLKSKRLPDGREIRFQYDSNNNLVSITPPGRPAHVQNYGQNELMSSYNPPALPGLSNVSTRYAYNKDKDLIKITRPDGEVINFNYNITTGLLDSMTGSFGTIVREYQNEQLRKISDNTGRYVLIGYTGKVVSSLETKDYKFSRAPSLETAGQVGLETVSANGKSQTVNYIYDEDKFLVQAGSLKLDYNSPNGQLIKTSLGKINESFTYSKYGEVKSFKSTFTKNGIQKILYLYSLERDILGRITKKLESFGEEEKHHRGKNHENENHERDEHENNFKNEYVYDSAGRLIHVHGSKRNSNYTYDQNSNRIHGHTGDQEFNAIYDNQDRLIRMNNSIFTYNANGDLLSRSEKFKKSYKNVNYIYDVFGNLSQAGNVSYKIDLFNRRSERLVNGLVTSKFAYNPEGQLIAELDKDGILKKTFIYASKSHVPDYFIDENQNEFKIIVDQLGSLRLIVNALTGEIVEKMNHDEFGKILIDTRPGLSPFGFAGGVYDSATRLVRFGVRDYNPEIGRWMSKDPIKFKGGDSNLYGYTFNDPVNLIDPAGLAGIGDTIWTGFITGTGAGNIAGSFLGGTIGAVFGGIPGGILGGYIGGTIGGLFDPTMSTDNDRVPRFPYLTPNQKSALNNFNNTNPWEYNLPNINTNNNPNASTLNKCPLGK